jgi:hypothetical protein
MANDLFEQYYTEKLWEAIPSIYRHEDGIAEEPGVLRGIVQVLAKQAAILRRSQDALWDDQFIETANEWAVPYIGDLVATRLLSAQNKRGRRIDVAKTIYYRRRKGTPRILEELINDISGWEGKLIEQFTKLVRTRHGLDAIPQTLAGKFSGTLPGGVADLRNQRVSELTNGPFEEYFHTNDMRKHQGLNGRYAIPKLAFYLYRLKAFEAIDTTPFAFGDGQKFTFDPSGRDIPLFSKSRRSPDWDEWKTAAEAELPAPIPCRLLGNAEYFITESSIQKLLGLSVAAQNELGKIADLKFKNEISLLNAIRSFPAAVSAEILSNAFLQPLFALSLSIDCGKSILLPDAEANLLKPLDENSILVGTNSPDSIFTTEKITAANLTIFPATIDKDLAIDAEKGRFMLKNALIDQTIFTAYHYGFAGYIGAGTYDRPWIADAATTKTGGGAITAANLPTNGTLQINDSKTYGPVASKTGIVSIIIQSKTQQRPYLQLATDWVLNSGANVNSSVKLDGLWIGALGDVAASIIIRGDFECFTIKSCTLDPGGSTNLKGEIIHPIQLLIEGHVENLCIEASILGPIKTQNGGIIEELRIEDSIVQSIDPTIKAIEINTGKTILNSCTIFGKIDVHKLEASEAIITAAANVVDTQNGCFRFSAAPSISRLPRPYESFLFESDTNHWYNSRRFGDPAFAQLSETSPKQLNTGAENGSEMGAFSSLLNPIKLDGLKTKIDEYMPFGLIPIFINKT